VTERRTPSRPSGWPPPSETAFGSERLALAPLAEEVAHRHLERHPDDIERYGELAREWAVHDMQHVLAWAFGESSGFVDLGHQVAWLAGILHARGYPLVNLADCLEEAAGVLEERVPAAGGVAGRLRDVAADVRP
jgi:hypothetical protein